MTRLPNWRSRLHAEINQWRARSFSWDGSDCTDFANACVHAVTGDDVLSQLWIKDEGYHDAESARAELHRLGFTSLAEALAGHFEPIEPILANEGDIAILPGDETGEGLGIILGERIAVMAPSGLATVRRSRAVKAFHIP